MIIVDEGRAMSSEVMTYIYEALRIKYIVISSENLGSLRTEQYIRTISEMLKKYISQQGQDWHLYLNACCYAHNTFVTPSMGYSPYGLVYLHKPTDLVDIRFDSFKGRTQNASEYINMMTR